MKAGGKERKMPVWFIVLQIALWSWLLWETNLLRLRLPVGKVYLATPQPLLLTQPNPIGFCQIGSCNEGRYGYHLAYEYQAYTTRFRACPEHAAKILKEFNNAWNGKGTKAKMPHYTGYVANGIGNGYIYSDTNCPNQGIEIFDNGKLMIAVNGKYKKGMIKTVMARKGEVS